MTSVTSVPQSLRSSPRSDDSGVPWTSASSARSSNVVQRRYNESEMLSTTRSAAEGSARTERSLTHDLRAKTAHSEGFRHEHGGSYFANHAPPVRVPLALRDIASSRCPCRRHEERMRSFLKWDHSREIERYQHNAYRLIERASTAPEHRIAFPADGRDREWTVRRSEKIRRIYADCTEHVIPYLDRHPEGVVEFRAHELGKQLSYTFPERAAREKVRRPRRSANEQRANHFPAPSASHEPSSVPQSMPGTPTSNVSSARLGSASSQSRSWAQLNSPSQTPHFSMAPQVHSAPPEESESAYTGGGSTSLATGVPDNPSISAHTSNVIAVGSGNERDGHLEGYSSGSPHISSEAQSNSSENPISPAHTQLDVAEAAGPQMAGAPPSPPPTTSPAPAVNKPSNNGASEADIFFEPEGSRTFWRLQADGAGEVDVERHTDSSPLQGGIAASGSWASWAPRLVHLQLREEAAQSPDTRNMELHIEPPLFEHEDWSAVGREEIWRSATCLDPTVRAGNAGAALANYQAGRSLPAEFAPAAFSVSPYDGPAGPAVTINPRRSFSPAPAPQLRADPATLVPAYPGRASQPYRPQISPQAVVKARLVDGGSGPPAHCWNDSHPGSAHRRGEIGEARAAASRAAASRAAASRAARLGADLRPSPPAATHGPDPQTVAEARRMPSRARSRRGGPRDSPRRRRRSGPRSRDRRRKRRHLRSNSSGSNSSAQSERMHRRGCHTARTSRSARSAKRRACSHRGRPASASRAASSASSRASATSSPSSRSSRTASSISWSRSSSLVSARSAVDRRRTARKRGPHRATAGRRQRAATPPVSATDVSSLLALAAGGENGALQEADFVALAPDFWVRQSATPANAEHHRRGSPLPPVFPPIVERRSCQEEPITGARCQTRDCFPNDWQDKLHLASQRPPLQCLTTELPLAPQHLLPPQHSLPAQFSLPPQPPPPEQQLLSPSQGNFPLPPQGNFSLPPRANCSSPPQGNFPVLQVQLPAQQQMLQPPPLSLQQYPQQCAPSRPWDQSSPHWWIDPLLHTPARPSLPRQPPTTPPAPPEHSVEPASPFSLPPTAATTQPVAEMVSLPLIHPFSADSTKYRALLHSLIDFYAENGAGKGDVDNANRPVADACPTQAPEPHMGVAAPRRSLERPVASTQSSPPTAALGKSAAPPKGRENSGKSLSENKRDTRVPAAVTPGGAASSGRRETHSGTAVARGQRSPKGETKAAVAKATSGGEGAATRVRGRTLDRVEARGEKPPPARLQVPAVGNRRAAARGEEGTGDAETPSRPPPQPPRVIVAPPRTDRGGHPPTRYTAKADTEEALSSQTPPPEAPPHALQTHAAPVTPPADNAAQMPPSTSPVMVSSKHDQAELQPTTPPQLSTTTFLPVIQAAGTDNSAAPAAELVQGQLAVPAALQSSLTADNQQHLFQQRGRLEQQQQWAPWAVAREEPECSLPACLEAQGARPPVFETRVAAFPGSFAGDDELLQAVSPSPVGAPPLVVVAPPLIVAPPQVSPPVVEARCDSKGPPLQEGMLLPFACSTERIFSRRYARRH